MSQSSHKFEVAPDTCFCIGVATIDPMLNQITIEGNVHKVQPRIMQVLLFLAARPGRVVTRATLFDGVWAEADHNDEALTQVICKLRNVFGDHAKEPKVIATIPKTGYCLIAPVTAITTPPPQPSSFQTASVSQPYPTKHSPKAKPKYLWITLVLFSIIVLETVWMVGGPTRTKRSSMDSIMLAEVRSLATDRQEPPDQRPALVPTTDEVNTNPNRLAEKLYVASGRPACVNNCDGPVQANNKVGDTGVKLAAPGCSAR